MQNHEHDDHESGRRGGPPSTRSQPRAARGPDPRKIVDLEAPEGAVPGIHNLAADLQGPPAWRLWLTVAIIGSGTAIALLSA